MTAVGPKKKNPAPLPPIPGEGEAEEDEEREKEEGVVEETAKTKEAVAGRRLYDYALLFFVFFLQGPDDRKRQKKKGDSVLPCFVFALGPAEGERGRRGEGEMDKDEEDAGGQKEEQKHAEWTEAFL